MKKVSISDIARKAGVSVSTVSFVMNDKAVKMRISREVIEKVENVAREMGYRPNQLARGLRTGKTKTIGLIVENISNAFFATLAKTIEDEAKKYDYKVVYCSTDNDEVKARELINMLSQRQVDGYIIHAYAALLADEIRKLQAENKPVVLIDRYFPEHQEIPAVLVDNYRRRYEGNGIPDREGVSQDRPGHDRDGYGAYEGQACLPITMCCAVMVSRSMSNG
jgi:LacI family transcriptional regulator